MSSASPDTARASSPSPVRIPWGYDGAWFDVLVDRIDGDRVYGTVSAVSPGAEEEVGATGFWIVSSVTAERLALALPADRSAADAAAALTSLFACRETVEVHATADGRVVVHDTAEDGLFAELSHGPDGWFVSEPAGLPIADFSVIGLES